MQATELEKDVGIANKVKGGVEAMKPNIPNKVKAPKKAPRIKKSTSRRLTTPVSKKYLPHKFTTKGPNTKKPSISKRGAGGTVENSIETGKQLEIQFGKSQNQVYHTFRKIDELGLSRTLVVEAIEAHFKTVASQIEIGKPFNQIVEIGGYKIQYTAFELAEGTINIGRIHGIK